MGHEPKHKRGQKSLDVVCHYSGPTVSHFSKKLLTTQTMPFNKQRYLTEMKTMVDKAIDRWKAEKIRFKIYSVSIWTDPNAGISSINFDTKSNSDKIAGKLNRYSKKKFDEFTAEGDHEMAALFKIVVPRNYNPTEFKLENFEMKRHSSIPKNWETKTGGNCWKELKPALTEVGRYAFKRIQGLPLDINFELAINSDKDWYDKTWKLK